MSQNFIISEEMLEASPTSECSDYVYEEVEPFDTCCLCPEGLQLQNQLIDHLKSQHPNGNIREILIDSPSGV